MAEIKAIAYYPVKGCAAVSASEVEMTAAGPRHDRTFMIITEDGTYRTQRELPGMARIRPEISACGTRLTLHAPGADALALDVHIERERRDVVLFGAAYQGIDQGDRVATWLSDYLGEASRLVRVPPEHDRVTPGQTPGTAAFADGNAVLITSRSSLDSLNDRILGHGGDPVPMERFRPNLVVDGWVEPHTEDRARLMTIGDAELGYARLALRCVVTTIDQRTGTKRGPEPLRTLARYRRTVDGGVAFGMKAAVMRPGKVSVGDEIIVRCWGEPDVG